MCFHVFLLKRRPQNRRRCLFCIPCMNVALFSDCFSFSFYLHYRIFTYNISILMWMCACVGVVNQKYVYDVYLHEFDYLHHIFPVNVSTTCVCFFFSCLCFSRRWLPLVSCEMLTYLFHPWCSADSRQFRYVRLVVWLLFFSHSYIYLCRFFFFCCYYLFLLYLRHFFHIILLFCAEYVFYKEIICLSSQANEFSLSFCMGASGSICSLFLSPSFFLFLFLFLLCVHFCVVYANTIDIHRT